MGNSAKNLGDKGQLIQHLSIFRECPYVIPIPNNQNVQIPIHNNSKYQMPIPQKFELPRQAASL